VIVLVSSTRLVAYFLGYHYTPYATEQGIILVEQGILA
jgi:hypothetical protein